MNHTQIIKDLLKELSDHHIFSNLMQRPGKCPAYDAIRAARKYLKKVKTNAS